MRWSRPREREKDWNPTRKRSVVNQYNVWLFELLKIYSHQSLVSSTWSTASLVSYLPQHLRFFKMCLNVSLYLGSLQAYKNGLIAEFTYMTATAIKCASINNEKLHVRQMYTIICTMNQGMKHNKDAEMTIAIALPTVLSLWSIIWRGTPACCSSSASVLCEYLWKRYKVKTLMTTMQMRIQKICTL